jgi:hypothetical protein
MQVFTEVALGRLAMTSIIFAMWDAAVLRGYLMVFLSQTFETH